MSTSSSQKHRPPTQQRSRRIPDAARRRAAVSCDRCKLRRAKCIRQSTNEACANCVSSGVQCESTLPRKQRVYGSVESLSLRFRVLEALVKGLFPAEDIQQVDVLYRLAAERGIATPPADDVPVSHEDVFEHPTTHGPEPLQENPFAEQPLSALAELEEKLIPTPHGIAHYLGPSSSFGFAATCRSMVARCSANPNCKHPRVQQRAVQNDFVSLRVTGAIESGQADQELDEAAEAALDSPIQAHRVPVQPKQGLVPFASSPADSRTDSVSMRNRTIEEFLPARNIADALVRAFFDRVHSNYPLFHRSMFQLRYEALWKRKSEQLRELNPGWVCCLAAIFLFGAQVLERHDRDQSLLIQKRYLNLARSYFSRMIASTSLLNVQALMLLQLYEHQAGERNAAWMLLGCASRMAVALGMHRENTNSTFDPIERNTRKMVWWTLYQFELTLSIILGRPSSIDEAQITVQLPDEFMWDGGDSAPQYAEFKLKLSKIAIRGRHIMYSSPLDLSTNAAPPPIGEAQRLLGELNGWYAALPHHLRPESNMGHGILRRKILLLHIAYHHGRCLVTRPHLIYKVNIEINNLRPESSQMSVVPDSVLELSRDGLHSAAEVGRYFEELARTNSVDGISWLDPYYAYHAVMVLALDSLAKSVNHVDPPEEVARKAATKSIVTCLRSTKLSPTYQLLAKVAEQFAAIVGALDSPGTDDSSNLQVTSRASDDQTGAVPRTSGYSVPGLTVPPTPASNWLQADPSYPVWDFFDIVSFPSAQSGTFNDMHYVALDGMAFNANEGYQNFNMNGVRESESVPIASETDDWATRVLRDMTRGPA
jgi:proline utilization trans-activator